MAKHDKLLAARKPREDDSLLIRSAESLGRMIGSLQRQLDDATKRLSGDGTGKGFRLDGADGSDGGTPRASAPKATAAQRAARPKQAPKQAKSGSKSGATKVRSTDDRKSKRASKSAAAKKTAGRSRSGASRRARKATRRA